MTQLRNVVWLVLFAAAFLLLPIYRVAAQNSVTPTVMPTPPGTLIILNNASDAVHHDPHVDSDLVCYTDVSPSFAYTVHYFDLATQASATVPTNMPFNASSDLLCDVRGTTIVFQRSTAHDSIFAFDTAVGGQPTEIAPVANSGFCAPERIGPQIGDQTIA